VTKIDVRLPIGTLFLVLGLLIGGYGLVTSGDSALYARSLAVNINLWWGGVMFAFGLVFVALGLRARS
jgi:membrane protein implicated in regulation of membrane protease activity